MLIKCSFFSTHTLKLIVSYANKKKPSSFLRNSLTASVLRKPYISGEIPGFLFFHQAPSEVTSEVVPMLKELYNTLECEVDEANFTI